MRKDILTFKRVYSLFERGGLEFIFNNDMKNINILEIAKKMAKFNILTEVCEELTGRHEVSLKEAVKILRAFFNEIIYQRKECEYPVKEVLSKIKFKNSFDPSKGKYSLETTNQYLDIEYKIGKVGNYNLSRMTLDEAIYILAQEAKLAKYNEIQQERR